MTERYWQFSKLAKWLERKAGIESPYALPWGEWDIFHAEAKKKAPVTFWVTRTLFSWAGKVFYWLPNRVNDVRIFIKNSTTLTHTLSGNLKLGKWYDLSYRLEHCLFEELVKFIEQEKTMSTLEWELSEDSGIDVPGQVEAAREQYAIYTWYKTVYPNRVDPHDASGLTEYYKDKPLFQPQPNDDHDIICEMIDKCRALEKAYADEDEEMLIRLIKIRHSLWT